MGWLQLGCAVDLCRCAQERLGKMLVSKGHVIVVVNVRASALDGCPQLFVARPPHAEGLRVGPWLARFARRFVCLLCSLVPL